MNNILPAANRPFIYAANGVSLSRDAAGARAPAPRIGSRSANRRRLSAAALGAAKQLGRIT